MKALPVVLGNINESNVLQLKAINISTLPVRYSDKFYKEVLLNSPQEYLKFAFWNGFAIAAVCSRIESHSNGEGSLKLYIMTINVLPAYRRRGVASALLKHVLDEAAKNPDIVEVYLHVQTSNEDARNFYMTKGFKEVETIYGYYKNIEPPDAFLLQMDLKKETTDSGNVDATA